MLIMVICALVGLGLGFLPGRNNLEMDSFMRSLRGIPFMLVGMITGILIVTLLSFVFLDKTQTEEVEDYNKTEIVALTDHSQLLGVSFMTSGSFGQREIYKFYVKTSNGGKQFRSLPAENITIFEEDRQDAYISKIKHKRKNSKVNKLIYWLVEYPMDFSGETGKYSVHVPKGTIKVEGPSLLIDMK